MKSLVTPETVTRPTWRIPSRRIIHADKADFTDQALLFDAIIDAVHEPILILDSKLTILSANKAFFKQFKAIKKHTYGTNLALMATRSPQAAKLISHLHKLSKRNESFEELELSYHFKKIGERSLLINAKRIAYGNKKSDAILLSIEDITHRKMLERQKDDFVGYVTHELKTPITSLSAFVQLLQGYHEKTGDKKSQFLLAKVSGQIERLTKLLNSFSHVYQAQSGMLILYKEQTNLYELVRETVETFQYTTSTHVISIDGMITKPISVDKERIRQVVINLLINAIKYSPDSDTIIVKLREESQNVIVSVQDFGPGIPEEVQTHIFERFFRIDHNKDPLHVKGLGLGLYIAMEIIKAHHGKLWVESTEGKGSTFSFSLPKTY